MSEPIRAKKFVEIRYWLEENAKKLLIAGFLSFMALSLVALTQGIGYQATANITSVEILYAGHPCLGYFVTGNLTCTFNPLLYPVTHIFGYETNLMFAGVSEPYDTNGKSVKESKEISVAFGELPKNVPYYLAISLAAAVGSSKLVERFRRATKSSPQIKRNEPVSAEH